MRVNRSCALSVLLLIPLADRANMRAQVRGRPTPEVYALEDKAQKAYNDKHYEEAVRAFEEAFGAGLVRSDDAYTAACSAALSHAPEKAIAYLQTAVQGGFLDPEQIKTDPDLESIRADPRFSAAVAKAADNQQAYNGRHRDPDRAAIVTSDIDLFWSVYDRRSSAPKAESLFEQDYFGRGSAGLEDFIFARIHSASKLLETIDKAPRYYAALRPSSMRIKEFTPGIRASFRKMKDLYADSIFPDVYFLIGRMNSGGTTGPSGLLIGVDMFGKGPGVPMDELSEWHKSVVGSVDTIPAIVAHELIHYEQHVAGKTLLAQAFTEGSADFIGELISGSKINQAGMEYGLQHEAELWDQFRREKSGTDSSHWMYEGKTVNGRPADLGYFVGYRIAEAYYKRASDKNAAVAEILNCSDTEKFLRMSGYGEQFKKP